MKAGREPISSPALDSLINNPTLTRSLFGNTQEESSASNFDFPSTTNTVDPARLSPPLLSIAEEEVQTLSVPLPSTTVETTNPLSEESVDMTQHPAAVLCDLQCQSTEIPREWMMFPQQQQALAWTVFLISAFSTAISLFQMPALWVACSLKAGLPLLPSQQVLNTIIWMVTRPSSKAASSSISYSTRQGKQTIPPPSSNQSPTVTPSRPILGMPSSRTLRSKYLKKILTSSPSLARPLADATLGILRLVSGETQGPPSFETTGTRKISPDGFSNGTRELPEGWISDAPLPSIETLVALLWAIKIEERKARSQRSTNSLTPDFFDASTSAVSYRVLESLSQRRCRSEQPSVAKPSEKSNEPTV